VDQSLGHFHFESSDETNGYHKICFNSNTTHTWFGHKNIFVIFLNLNSEEFHVEIRPDALPQELKEYTKKDKIDRLNSQVAQMDVHIRNFFFKF
jgi:hypothetical protein